MSSEHPQHLQDNFSANDIFDTNDTGQPIILESLWKLDELLKEETTTRERVDNLDLVSTPKGDFYVCHLATLLDFTHVPGSTYAHALEAAGAIALAAHHLNSGIYFVYHMHSEFYKTILSEKIKLRRF